MTEQDRSAAIAGAVLRIDLDAIADNWRLLRGLCGRAECGAVVKADGYGLGAVPVARTLAAAGCADAASSAASSAPCDAQRAPAGPGSCCSASNGSCAAAPVTAR